MESEDTPEAASHGLMGEKGSVRHILPHLEAE